MYLELIINSVVLLFVNEVDSQVFSIAYIFNSKWLHTVVDEAEEYSDFLLEQDVVDDSVLEVKSQTRPSSSKRLISVANSLRDSAQDQARASGSGSSSSRSRSMKSSNLRCRESQQQQLMTKFESLQRQMSELQAELTGTLDHEADKDDEGNDQAGQEDEIPQQQSSCAVQ